MNSIKLKPLSVNAAWQGRRFKTPEYTMFRKEFALLNGTCKTKAVGPITLDITFTLTKKSFGLTDVDNLLKPTIDAIVECGCIADDRNIIELTARKRLGEDYEITFEIHDTKETA